MKVSGSYASLVRGVSQQVPQDRGPGQHTEMVNMIPDPVKGLTRRHGSRYQAERALDINPGELDNLIADTANWRTFEYSNANKDYVVLARRANRGSSVLDPVIVYNRTDKVFLNYVRNMADDQLDLLEEGGISAITAIGKYVFMAGNNTVAEATSTNLWADPDNQERAVVWIRGGAYARTFKVTATRTDDVQFDFEYTTPTSSYPGVLDTSNVPVYAADPAGGTSTDTEAAYIVDNGSGVFLARLSWHAWNPSALSAKKGATTMTNVHPAAPANNLQYAWNGTSPDVTFHSSNGGALDVSMTYTHTKTITNPNYAKTVTDLTNAYNSAVTNWIGESAEAITPAKIAESLRDAAIAAGLTTATAQESTVIFDNVKALSVNDGGDGALIRGVANEVTSVDQVSDLHYVGKIVKVRARDSKEAFYLKAVAKDGISTGYVEVTWVEGAGTQHTITDALLYGTASGSNFYVASSASLLNAILPGTHPNYEVSACGDADSSPLPYFIGKKITYLGVFQDRLLVGAGAVLRCSQIGNYLNFFRSSVLTVPADDPLEVLSQGTEDDELRHSVIYDRDLIIFGKKRQYAISGRQALTPTSANMQVMSSHSNAADVPPLAAGGVIFYGQLGEKASSLHQIEPGQVAESPESFIQSSQIDTYIRGQVIEITNHSKPTHVFLRATSLRNSLYCFTYLDKQGQGRVQDAWGRWDYNEDLGPIIGMSPTADGLLIYRLQTGVREDASGSDTWVVADLQPLTTGLSEFPYLDSMRPWEDVDGADAATHQNTLGDWHIVFDGSSEYRFIGNALADAEDLLEEFPSATGPYVGAMQYASFTPTNPFVRDRNDKAITSGRLVVTTVLASTEDTSGFVTEVAAGETTDTTTYNGRLFGDPNNEIGREPVTDSLQSLPIGRETREYTLTIKPRTWMPFTLTTLEWIGQFFNRTQRF